MLWSVWLPMLACLFSYGAETKQEEKPEKRKITNEAVVVTLEGFCRQANLPKQEHGTGKVKVIVVGQSGLGDAPSKMVSAAEQALKALEIFTGQQGAFWNDLYDAKRVHVLVLFANDPDFLAYVDFLRKFKIMGPPEGRDDLVVKLLNFGGPMATVIIASKAVAFPANFAVHTVTCQAIQAFFLERGDAAIPPWLHEGLSAELQRMLCNGRVLWSSISYEMSSPEMQGNWALDVASMIKRNDKMLRKASYVLDFNLASLPGAHYKLMWSLCTMLVKTAANRKGDKNKLYLLMDEIAKGTKSEQAVKKVFGIAEPALTQAWFNWALTQK